MKHNILSEERYQKQELVFGAQKQKLLTKKNVAIVGLGALGSNCAELLTRAGVGNILLIDRDIISFSNLQRQYLYDENDIDKAKAAVCQQKLQMINSEIKIQGIIAYINFKNIERVLSPADCVIDCTDNLTTRLLLNDFCVKFGKSLVHGAVARQMGSVYVYTPDKDEKNKKRYKKNKKRACLACFYDDKLVHETCDVVGVMNTASSIIGSLQAQECLKLLIGEKYETQFVRFDFTINEIMKINAYAVKNCRTCVERKYIYLSGKEKEQKIAYCGVFHYQIEKWSLKKKFDLKKKWTKIGKVIDLGYCIHFGKITLFNDGRVLLKVATEDEAKQLYSTYIGD